MNFCTNCENMLYIQLKTDTANELLYYCRNCDNKEPINNDNLCVSKINLKHSAINYENTNSSPAGGYYLDMHVVCTYPKWYLGATSFHATFSNHYKIGNGEPYINIFVKSNDNYSNQSVEIMVKTSGVQYNFYAPLYWSGWRLVSIKLSDFRNQSGVNLTDSDYPNIDEIFLNLGAGPQQSKEVQLYYDFIFLSYDKPLSNKNSGSLVLA